MPLFKTCLINVYNMTKSKYLFLIYFLSFTQLGCGQYSSDSCKANLQKARDSLNSYWQSKYQSSLQSALMNVDNALYCELTRKAAVRLKISILSTMKKYADGARFVSSIKENDFELPYQKKYYESAMKAMEFESKSDMASRDKFYNEAIGAAQQYVDAHPNLLFDQFMETYGDIFLIKLKIEKKEQIDAELNNLITKYPDKKDFFDALRNMGQNVSDSVSAIPN